MSGLDDAGRQLAARADHEQRMAAARARATWELGDPSWAGVILGAYLYPDADAAALAAERTQ